MEEGCNPYYGLGKGEVTPLNLPSRGDLNSQYQMPLKPFIIKYSTAFLLLLTSSRVFSQSNSTCFALEDSLFNTFINAIKNGQDTQMNIYCEKMNARYYKHITDLVNRDVVRHKISADSVVSYYAFNMSVDGRRLESAIAIYKIGKKPCKYYLEVECMKEGDFITKMSQFYSLYIQSSYLFLFTTTADNRHTQYVIMKKEFEKMINSFLKK